MDMNTAEQVLVVILATMLAIFLFVSILAVIKFVQILQHIKRLTEKAEQIADKAESVTEFFQATAGPAAIAKIVANILGAVKHKSNKTKE